MILLDCLVVFVFVFPVLSFSSFFFYYLYLIFDFFLMLVFHLYFCIRFSLFSWLICMLILFLCSFLLYLCSFLFFKPCFALFPSLLGSLFECSNDHPISCSTLLAFLVWSVSTLGARTVQWVSSFFRPSFLVRFFGSVARASCEFFDTSFLGSFCCLFVYFASDALLFSKHLEYIGLCCLSFFFLCTPFSS